MGLGIAVGELAKAVAESDAHAELVLRKDLASINKALRQHGLPEHREPETLPALANRCSLVGFPYSYLHVLRRVAALVRAGQPVTSVADDDNWSAIPISSTTRTPRATTSRWTFPR